jgi:death-on-curing protein
VSSPVFLSIDQIEYVHQRSIEEFGGTLGLRDRAALESAIFHPQNVYFYAGGDLFDIAAAYAFHIAEAQAYLDGNKRTAVGAALVFLNCNGVSTSTDSMPVYEVMIAIAERRAGKPELAEVLRELFGSS